MTGSSVRLGLNIDHVATLRNARGGAHPDPARAAQLAQKAGAENITLHIREDRRHARESDLAAIAAAVSLPINLEMAATPEMREIALASKPHACCLVPERRGERTTEGGLDVAGADPFLGETVAALRTAGVRVSLFIDPLARQIEAARALGAHCVELHTGAFCDAVRAGDESVAREALRVLEAGAEQAAGLGLEVHAGHGIDFDSVGPIARIAPIRELNIGHFLIGEALFMGLGPAVARMRSLIAQARMPVPT